MKVVSVDCVNIYPSIKLATIRKAVRFFSRRLTAATKNTINLDLDLVRFGVSSTLISFEGGYYEYHGGDNKDQGLAIWGYESAFLSNLVVSYLFEKSKNLLNRTTYQVIYYDRGLLVYSGVNV